MTTPLYAVALSAYLGTGIYLYVQRLRTVGADLAADKQVQMYTHVIGTKAMAALIATVGVLCAVYYVVAWPTFFLGGRR